MPEAPQTAGPQKNRGGLRKWQVEKTALVLQLEQRLPKVVLKVAQLGSKSMSAHTPKRLGQWLSRWLATLREWLTKVPHSVSSGEPNEPRQKPQKPRHATITSRLVCHGLWCLLPLVQKTTRTDNRHYERAISRLSTGMQYHQHTSLSVRATTDTDCHWYILLFV